MEEQRDQRYDIIVLLQPTAPIRDPAHIDEAVVALAASNLPTLASVKGPFKKRDPILKRIEHGVLKEHSGADQLPEKWQPFYLYNASIYAARRAWFVEHNTFVSANQVPLLMDALHSVDVDEEADLAVAEALLIFERERQQG